jgi:FMN reductase
MPSILAITGNPKPASRTAAAAGHVARRLGEVLELPVLELDLAASAPTGDEFRRLVAEASILVVASPTYKATYSGLLKGFLDGLPHDALAGKVAIPMMIAADRAHALAVELLLRPVLVELGAITPTRGIFLEERSLPDLDTIVEPWLDRARPTLAALLAVAVPR